MKLASYLNSHGEVFVLDEPTDGLHMKDIQNILELFNRMTEQGNSLYLIEHNLEILKEADYVIELGPGGGNEGGNLLYAGEPKGLLSCDASVTRKYL